MKTSLTCLQKDEDLEKVNEIIVPFNKMHTLLELVEKFPTKDFVMDLPKGLALDYRSVAMCAERLRKGTLYVRIHDLNPFTSIAKCKEHNLKFFWAGAAKNFYELYGLKKLGVSYVYVEAPLFFQMDEVKKVGIPLRLIPNKCYSADIPRDNGLHGCWVRPEKLDLYEPYASILEFYSDGPTQEMAFYRIYCKDKKWEGDMGLLYWGFNLHMDNQLVYEGLDEMRLNCGQKCETTKPYCLMCDKVRRFEKIGREWAEEAIKRQEQENTN